MDELDRDLANGLLGWDQADRAMSGDLTGAYRDMAAREWAAQQDACRVPAQQAGARRVRPSGPLIPLPTVAVLLVLVLVLVIAVAVL